MEDARQAEVLLERLRLHEFVMQLREQPLTDLLDGVFVSMIQSANGFLSIRDRLHRAANSRDQAVEMAKRSEAENKELTEEMERRSQAAEQVRAALEADRDAWLERARGAEERAAREALRSEAAERAVAAVTESLGAAQREVADTTRELSVARERAATADGRADAAWAQAKAAEVQLQEAGRRASAAEERAGRTDELNQELSRAIKDVSGRLALAEEEARKANDARLLVAAQLWDAEVRFEEAENRAWRAEAEASERVKKAVDGAIDSPAVREHLLEAATDAYGKGFADCKVQVARTYGLRDMEAICPGDLDDSEAPDAEGSAEEAGESDGSEAGGPLGP